MPLKISPTDYCPGNYVRVTDIEPSLRLDTLTVSQGTGHRRSLGTPRVDFQPVLSTGDLCSIVLWWTTKHSKGQSWRHYRRTGRLRWERRTWTQLTQSEQEAVHDAWEDPAVPGWVRSPGAPKNLATAIRREEYAPVDAYKIVRVRDDDPEGTYRSTFDPGFLYETGKRASNPARPHHQGGLYAYPGDPEEILARFHAGTLLPSLSYAHPRRTYALVTCELSGKRIGYEGGKLAATYCRITGEVCRFSLIRSPRG